MPKRKLTNHLGSTRPVSKGLPSLLKNELQLKHYLIYKIKF